MFRKKKKTEDIEIQESKIYCSDCIFWKPYGTRGTLDECRRFQIQDTKKNYVRRGRVEFDNCFTRNMSGNCKEFFDRQDFAHLDGPTQKAMLKEE